MLQYILKTVSLSQNAVHIQSWLYILQTTLRAKVACAGMPDLHILLVAVNMIFLLCRRA